MAADRRSGNHGLLMVSDETFMDLSMNSTVLFEQWFAKQRALSKTECVTALKPPMFVKKYDPRAPQQQPTQSGPMYVPKKADELCGPFYANRQNQKLAMQWFSKFTENYYASRANPNPLLILMGPTGSSKTFCLHWMCTAFDVDVHFADPLDYKQSSLATPKRKKNTKVKSKPKPKPKPKPKSKKKTKEKKEKKEEGGESGEDDGATVDAREEDEERLLRRLSSSAIGGEALRQLLLSNPVNKPTLIHIQDVQLCKPEFLRYLIALVPLVARTPGANGIVIELTPDEAFRQQFIISGPFRDGGGGGGGGSLGTFLQKFRFGSLLKFFPAKPRESREFLLAYRKRLHLPPDPNLKQDDATLSRIALEARGDIRQLEILIEWDALPRIPPPSTLPSSSSFSSSTSSSSSSCIVVRGARSISPPPSKPPAAKIVQNVEEKEEEWSEGGGVGSSVVLGSDLDVGTLLIESLTSRRPFGYNECSAICSQLRSFPLLQVAEFLRSWILSFGGISGGVGGGCCPLLVTCSTDGFIQLMIRGIQLDSAMKARKFGSFLNYKHIKQLPTTQCLDIFGQPRRIAIISSWFIDRILEHALKSQSQPTTKEPIVGSLKRRAVGLITVDKEGRLEIDKMTTSVSRKKRKEPAGGKAPAEIQLKRSHKPPAKAIPDEADCSWDKIGEEARELQVLSEIAGTLSDFDVHPFLPDGEIHFVHAAHEAVARHHLELAAGPDWPTISKWLHPRRFDFTGPSRHSILKTAPITQDPD